MSMSGRGSARTADESTVVIMDPAKAHDMHGHSFYAQPHSGLSASPGGAAGGDAEGGCWERAFPFRTVLAALLLLALYSSVVVSVGVFSHSPAVPTCSPTDPIFPCQVPDEALMAALSPPAPSTAVAASPRPQAPAVPPQEGKVNLTTASRVCLGADTLSSAQRQVLPSWGGEGGGHRLSGDVPVHILWYGDWADEDKGAIRDFLSSLNEDVDPSVLGYPKGTPSVKDWWSTVGNALGRAVGGPGITASLGEEMDAGLDFGQGFIPPTDVPSILSKVTAARAAGPGKDAASLPADPAALYLVLVGAGVVTPLLCTLDSTQFYNGLWAGAGLVGPKNLTYAYAVSPNQGKDCNVTAAVSKVSWLKGTAPSGDASLDAVIDLMAGAMASAVTNADGQGFVSTETCQHTLNNNTFNCDIYTTCRYHYGRVGAAPTSGAAYNTVGKGGTPYLLNQLFGGSCTLGGPSDKGVFNSTLPLDYGYLNWILVPWTLLNDVKDLDDGLAPPAGRRLPSPQSLAVPSQSQNYSASADFSPLDSSLESLRETGLINALAASGRNFTVFVPEAGGAPVGGPQDGQLYLVAQGRYNAAALKAAATAGTPLVSLHGQEKLSVGYTAPPASSQGKAATGKLTVGYGSPTVQITTPDLYCTSAVCFHGVETTL